MPAMLRTSKKARKIAEMVKGLPQNHESKSAKAKEKETEVRLMWADMRRQR